MIKFGALFVFVLALALVLGQNDTTTQETSTVIKTTQTLAPTPTDGPTTPTDNPTTPTDNPTTPTDNPTTPTDNPTTPTDNPTTPTDNPTTPTVGPTTLTDSPTTLTAAHSTPAAITTAPPVTTTQTPAPSRGNFSNDCIMLLMAAQFNIFNAEDNKTVTVNLPENSNATQDAGDCGGNNTTSQVITIPFATESSDVLKLTFVMADNQFSLHQIELTYQKLNLLATNQTLFKATVDNSYQCSTAQSVKLTEDNSSATMDMDRVWVQAFMKQEQKFGPIQECEADSKTSNIVPIAVGAALAALVVIVLIAYLISRSRNQSGYESV